MLWLARWLVVQALVGYICLLSVCMHALAFFRLARRTKRCKKPATLSTVTEGIISVVIPAYNEAAIIGHTLRNLEATTADKQRVRIILVDAGCKDNTVEVVKASNCRISVKFTKASGGRGPALNQGASLADGDILLFLHADTLVPPGWDNVLRHNLANPAVLATAFKFEVNRTQLAGKRPVGLRFLEAATNFRANRFMLPLGEQGLAMTTSKFREYGGFPNLAMMEDVELVWKLRKEALAGAGTIKLLTHASALSSPKRFEKNGVFRAILTRQLALLAYVYFGVSPQRIYRWCYHDGPRVLPWLRF